MVCDQEANRWSLLTEGKIGMGPGWLLVVDLSVVDLSVIDLLVADSSPKRPVNTEHMLSTPLTMLIALDWPS